MLIRRDRWGCIRASNGGQTWSWWEEHSGQGRERLRPCDVAEQATKETSGELETGGAISGWLDWVGRTGLQIACVPKCRMHRGRNCGPAWFSQPIVVTVTFGKD